MHFRLPPGPDPAVAAIDKIGLAVSVEKGCGAPAGLPRPFVPRAFRPALWLPGAHAQTMAGRVIRDTRATGLRRERIDTPDGDFLDLDFTPLVRSGRPIVLLLHGLEGSSRRGYALNTYRSLGEYGVGCVGLNFRSCSGEPNRLARSYHSGETGDLRFVIDLLAERFPDSPLGIVGFSLGGNALLKWLGEEPAATAARITACVGVSVPYDLAACERALDSTAMGRFYVRRFLATLIEKVNAKAGLLENRIDLERARNARTFREFDDAVTAPVHGFDGVDDYYARSSCAPVVHRIRVPVLLIHADDDPFMPGEAAPWTAIRANPATQSVVTPHGGHVGFIQGWPWRLRFWAEEEAARFLAQRLQASLSDRTS